MYDFCARHWLSQHRLIAASVARAQVNWRRDRAEDLSRGGREALRRFCQWAGIRADAADLQAMRRPERSVFARPGPPGAEGGMDPHFLSAPRLRPVVAPPTLDLDPRWNVDAGVAAAIRGLARQFGYGDEEGDR
jgi:hypothetical protein